MVEIEMIKYYNYQSFIAVKFISTITAIFHSITCPILRDAHLFLAKKCVRGTGDWRSRKLEENKQKEKEFQLFMKIEQLKWLKNLPFLYSLLHPTNRHNRFRRHRRNTLLYSGHLYTASCEGFCTRNLWQRRTSSRTRLFVTWYINVILHYKTTVNSWYNKKMKTNRLRHLLQSTSSDPSSQSLTWSHRCTPATHSPSLHENWRSSQAFDD